MMTQTSVNKAASALLAKSQELVDSISIESPPVEDVVNITPNILVTMIDLWTNAGKILSITKKYLESSKKNQKQLDLPGVN